MATFHVKDRKTRKNYTYITQKALGAGGLSRVYLAKKITDDQDDEQNTPLVAIKVCSTAPKESGLLAKEADILSTIANASRKSPNKASRIVRIGAEGNILESQSDVLIELEYLDGKTLERWLIDDWHDLANDPQALLLQAAIFALQITEALDELERASRATGSKLMHRDLKPANIMVTPNGLRLFDFNVATDRADQTYLTKVGTPDYQAPEVQLGEFYDQRADLWSLGVIFWELLHNNKNDIPSSFYISDDFIPPFPTKNLQDIDPVARDLAKQIFGLLLRPLSHRAKDHKPAQELLQELIARLQSLRRPAPPPILPKNLDDELKELDLIQLISELRPDGQNSVVANVDDRSPLLEFLREKTEIHVPLEDYLVQRIKNALNNPGPTSLRLLVLSGNAGDGKSYLIDRLRRHHLKKLPGIEDRIALIADATHALSPTESRQHRLEKFFSGFAKGQTPKKDLYIIAMNTGMVINFFENAAHRFQNGDSLCGDLSELYKELERQLGLRRSGDGEEFPPGVEVINLDLRSLVHNTNTDSKDAAQASFFEQMIQKLDPDAPDGLLTPKIGACQNCPARSVCPVHFNLRALQREDVRQALLNLVRRASLDPEVHLSPRNLWAFLYRIITGGLERYKDSSAKATTDSLCDVVRAKAQDDSQFEWFFDGHLSEQLFAYPDLGGLWSALYAIDPAYATVPELDRLQTRLSVDPTLDTATSKIKELGGDADSLAGHALTRVINKLPGSFPIQRRINAAIRRHILFNHDYFNAYYQYGEQHQFETLLKAYKTFSRDIKSLSEEQREALKSLSHIVRDATVRSFGRTIRRGGEKTMLRVSQPNIRSESILLVETTGSDLDQHFQPTKLIDKDVHIDIHVKRDRQDLLQAFAHQPKLLYLKIEGHRLIVDQAFFSFLTLVKNGQQPSSRDLSQFQTLRFVARRLGDDLAKSAKELFILNNNTNLLSRLSQDDFGGYKMETLP